MTKARETEFIDGEDVTELEKLLVGRKIVAVDKRMETLALDNGDVLEVQPNYGCGGCSSGNYGLISLATCENAIMRVEVRQEDFEEDEYTVGERLSIFVYAEGISKEVVVVEGDEGNGYYGRGFEIEVIRAS